MEWSISVYSYQTAIKTRSTTDLDRYELLLDLSNRGWSNKYISTHLNTFGPKPPRTDEWYPNLVWATLKKLRDRRQRENTTYWDIETDLNVKIT